MNLFSKMFTGIEVEGPDRGEMTLFIPRDAEDRHEFLTRANRLGITRLYFGASNNRGIHPDISEYQLSSIPKNFKVLLEVDSDCPEQLSILPLNFLVRTEVIFVFEQLGSVIPRVNTFKIVTRNKVLWYTLDHPVESDLDDPLYEKDKEAEI